MWFDASAGALIGAILGTSLGLFGGVWGAVTGVSASKGKCRRLVLNWGWIMVGAGVLFLLVAGVAFFAGQPYHVWYPFLMAGLWPTIFLPFICYAVKKAYTASELKKMSIDDLK